jgi:hypothetical protein
MTRSSSRHARRTVILQWQPATSFQTRGLFRSKGGLSHEMQQVIVCRRLLPLRSVSVVEYRNTQCARRRSFLSYLGGRSDGQTAMHKQLSCTLSRLSSSKPVAVVRMSGCLPGLHPIHLYWFRTRMSDVPFAAVSGALFADILMSVYEHRASVHTLIQGPERLQRT